MLHNTTGYTLFNHFAKHFEWFTNYSLVFVVIIGDNFIEFFICIKLSFTSFVHLGGFQGYFASY